MFNYSALLMLHQTVTVNSAGWFNGRQFAAVRFDWRQTAEREKLYTP
jgi:hypothetical protein